MTISSAAKLGVVLILVASQCLGACAFQPVAAQAETIRSSVDVGDTVRVTMHDGDERVFRVTEIGADRLLGETEAVAYTDIARLQRRQANNAVIWTVVGVAIVAAAAGGSSGGSY